MEKSCVLQALDYLHKTSDEVLAEEWKQIESLNLPYVDANDFVKESMGKFNKLEKESKTSFIRKIACL